MTALVERHYGPLGAEEPPHAPVTGEEQWAGIYQGESKIGYAVGKIIPEGEGYKAYETVFMRLKVMGHEKDARMTTEAELDRTLRLKSFIFVIESDVPIKIEGTVEGRSLGIRLSSGGATAKQRIPLKEEPYISLHAFPSGERLEPGKTFRFPMLDPSTLTEGALELEVEGKETIEVMGGKVPAWRLKGSFMGADVTLWVDESGEILKEEAMGFTTIREEKETALRLEGPSIDIIARTAVPFDMKLPRNISRLKVRLSGIDFTGLELDGGSQRLTGSILEVAAVPLSSIANAPNAPLLADMDEYLKETLFIQSKDPEIAGLAKEIAGEGMPETAEETLKRARLIHEWVYKNLKKVPAITLPTAVEVLRSRRGDCNEHTTLYVALARASGVPSRIAVGLVYKDGYFYYHAWPEIYIGGWVPIDPTFGQFPADASHIRLITGDLDKQALLLRVVGKLKLQWVDNR